MKKTALLLSVAMMALACSNNQSKETGYHSNVFVEQKVQEFVKNNPDWLKGETANAEITDKFQHEVKRWSNEEDFIKDMPLQLQGLRDTTLSGQPFKIGTFIGFSDTTRPTESLLNHTQLRIDGILPPELETKVKKDGKYTLTGMLYKQGSRKDVKVIKVADFEGYDLGKYLFSITAVKPL